MEMLDNPMEYRPLPEEYSVPQEYPKEGITQKRQENKICKKHIVMFAFFGFVALQATFGYLFPQHDNKFDPIEPPFFEQDQPPVGDSERPPINSGDFTPDDTGKMWLDPNEVYGELTAITLQLDMNNYIAASAKAADFVSQNYSSYQSGTHMEQYIFADDKLEIFHKQDLTDGSGYYFLFRQDVIEEYDPKADMYFTEPIFEAVFIHAQRTGNAATAYKILTVQTYTNYLANNDGFLFANCFYFTAETDDAYNAECAERICFTLTSSDGNYPGYSYNGYYVSGNSISCGAMQAGEFYGKTTYRDTGLCLNGDCTALVYKQEYEEYVLTFDLTSGGLFDFENVEILDLSEQMLENPESYYELLEKAALDPDVQYIQGAFGDETRYIYIRSLLSESPGYYGYYLEDRNWNRPIFPLRQNIGFWQMLGIE